MNRFRFLAALFGFGASAQIVQTEGTTESKILKWYLSSGNSNVALYVGADNNAFLGKSKPKNNQCPVCGTMAEPVMKERLSSSEATVYKWVNCIRCEHCNTAFWQDAE